MSENAGLVPDYSVVCADNRGVALTAEQFNDPKCPLCGNELKFGEGDARMVNTTELSMVTDIDSGEQIEGHFRAAVCIQDDYQRVQAEITGYAGY